MPTFCRHGRFLERCPICSKTLPGNAPEGGGSRGGGRKRQPSGAARGTSGTARRGGPRAGGLRVSRQQRAVEDGYSSSLLPGVRASADAERLASEIAFANGRLLALSADPPDARLPDLYGEVRELASSDVEQATWVCFLTAYLCPLESEQPFAGIRQALLSERDELDDLDDVPLGPRSTHNLTGGATTLDAYRAWYQQAGSQLLAFTGDESWSAQRRFERLFERLALPGLSRAARYELLVLLGSLGVYELQAGSLQLAGARVGASEDPTVTAAKRIFAIGDPLLLERRAATLAQALAVPIAALDLALANWIAERRATVGFEPDVADGATLELAREELGL
ncbi:MAG TPA: hypothetical protein VH081_05320 [Solirubrobacteraceae bacterium]|nr:hypothetical protein [Solirubrobacteraceae bacterium]